MMIQLKEEEQQFDLQLTNKKGEVEYYKGFEPSFEQFKALMAIKNPTEQAESLVKIMWPSLKIGLLSLRTVKELSYQASQLLEENIKKK